MSFFSCKYVTFFVDFGQTVNIHAKKDAKRGVVNNQLLDWSFKMDGILHNASQDKVYEDVASPLVTELLDGYNGMCMQCICAFTVSQDTQHYSQGLVSLTASVNIKINSIDCSDLFSHPKNLHN